MNIIRGTISVEQNPPKHPPALPESPGDGHRLSPLELAAVSYVVAREDFDASPYVCRQRYRFGPWKTYALAWARLKAEVARAVAVEAEKQETHG